MYTPDAAPEWLQAYADYNDLMSMTETMISDMVKDIKGSYKIQYHANGPDADPVEIDFTPPWRRVSMIEELEKVLGVEIPKDLYSAEATEFLKKLCKDKEVECSPPHVRLPALSWCNDSVRLLCSSRSARDEERGHMPSHCIGH